MFLYLLPVEILETIFSYLDTPDVLNLREVHSRFADISCSGVVIKKVKLFNCYDLNKSHLDSFFGKRPVCENITSFNITSVYWITAADLRKCISSMSNLKQLYVVDTKLGLIKPDVQLYRSLSKLQRLGLTILKKTFCKEAIQNFPALTHMYLHVHSSALSFLQILLQVVSKYDILEELWVVEIGLPIHSWLSLSVPRFISNLTVSAMNIIYQRESLEYNNLSMLFMSNVTDHQFHYRRLHKKVPLLYDRELNDQNWSYVLKLRRCSPFTPKQFEEIYFDDTKLSHMEFNEISMVHPDIKCTVNFASHVSNVLLYDNMKHLKKLGLNYCACLIDKDLLVNQPLKKPKLEDKTLQSTCLLSKISEHSTGIEELELWACQRALNEAHITDGMLESIATFKNLTKLLLDNIPPLASGAFLFKVLSDCEQLTSLCIRSKQHNATLHNILCKALQNAVNLKELRYEHLCNIAIDRLFESLVTNTRLKLNRLFIKCCSVEVFSVKPLRNFLAMNPQLTLLYIVIADLPYTAIKNVRRSLDEYKTDPRKIFMITKNEYPYESTINVPHIHLHQMIKLASRVSTIDVFNDFI